MLCAYLGGGPVSPMQCFMYKKNNVRADLHSTKNSSGKMSLSTKDKETVKAFWSKVSGKTEDIGNDALSR